MALAAVINQASTRWWFPPVVGDVLRQIIRIPRALGAIRPWSR